MKYSRVYVDAIGYELPPVVVTLPLTAAIAKDRGFLRPGDRVGFLGIGSGLNCLMLGLEW